MKTHDGEGITSVYCVAKYGHKWVRTQTVTNSFAPKFNEQYTWEVYDPSTFLTVAKPPHYKPNASENTNIRTNPTTLTKKLKGSHSVNSKPTATDTSSTEFPKAQNDLPIATDVQPSGGNTSSLGGINMDKPSAARTVWSRYRYGTGGNTKEESRYADGGMSGTGVGEWYGNDDGIKKEEMVTLSDMDLVAEVGLHLCQLFLKL
ncbi:hypothetical protein OSB04_025117 [Centaurea solstitialis]|uniref:C2 domain-containing protein n=1 Tax=Centaurea solstitialis TaxID=347529 RepID=A0AA38SZS8_9ASTR|nr:hypothetical protein OSB04_025117 [Centaurea solstitialis]